MKNIYLVYYMRIVEQILLRFYCCFRRDLERSLQTTLFAPSNVEESAISLYIDIHTPNHI